MLSRRVLVALLAVLLLAGAATIALAQAPTAAPAMASGTPGAVGIAATPPATPTGLGKLANRAGSVDDAVTKIVTAILKALGGALLIVLLAAVLGRFIILLRRPPQLVIEKISNATGDNDVDKAADGISQLSRERLLSALDYASGWVRQYLRDLLGREHPNLEQYPPPSGVTDASIATLVTAIKESVPAQIKPAVQLLSVVFQEKGTRVSATLQRRIAVPDTPGQLGISFVVADIRGKRAPTLQTIWESPVVQPPGAPTPGTPPAIAEGDAGRPSGAAESIAPASVATFILYEIGALLTSVSLFEDAANYLTDALGKDPSFADAAADLAQCVARLQVQRSTTAAYAQGQKMQDAGLIEPAITNYLLPLAPAPPEEQVAVEAAWRTVLKLTPGDETQAYYYLARAYYGSPAWLPDQALALFKQAAAHGSSEARSGLQHIQGYRAATLTSAGQMLLDLGSYVAAEKYATMALTAVPDDPQALALLAAIKQGRPASENTDAAALYALGQIYESRGALVRAQAQYEESLKKQPTEPDARSALARVIAAQQTVTSRAIALLDPAARWLGLHLLERGMRASRPRSSFGREHHDYAARVANFFGYFYQASAADFPSATSFFFDQTIAAFRRAIGPDATWYLPHLNLAETYTLMKRYHDARAEYACALKLLPPGAGSPEIPRRIHIGTARALLGEGDEKRAQGELDDAERDWKPEAETNIPTLYNLASCYANKTPLRPEDARRAREYLVYALARAGKGDEGRCLSARAGRWQHLAATDHDLNAIRDAEGFADLEKVMEAILGQSQAGKAADAVKVGEIVARTRWTAAERSRADVGS